MEYNFDLLIEIMEKLKSREYYFRCHSFLELKCLDFTVEGVDYNITFEYIKPSLLDDLKFNMFMSNKSCGWVKLSMNFCRMTKPEGETLLYFDMGINEHYRLNRLYNELDEYNQPNRDKINQLIKDLKMETKK